MKNFITKYACPIILAAMFILLAPSLLLRFGTENANDNITLSVLYNDLATKISSEDLDIMLDDYMEAGIDTISVMEEDINQLVQRGDVTCIKYNVLLHKYDDESMNVGYAIEEACPDVILDSYILLAKREETRKKLAYQLPRRYGDDDYMYIGEVENMDIYVLYDGHKEMFDYAIGYNEETIKSLYDRGFNISLIHKVKNYDKTEYQDDIARIIKTYDVEYLNLKEDSQGLAEGEEINHDNYEGLIDIINSNDLTLVVTENTNQLSNQRFLGYNNVYNAVSKGGSGKVIRSYETYDDSQADETNYKYRVSQYFNSTMDRNIRFIPITQIAVENLNHKMCAEKSFEAATEYKSKIEQQGYTVNQNTEKLDYTPSTRFNGAASAVIMVMAAALMLVMVFGISDIRFFIGAIILGALSFIGTFVIPVSLISLYPTLYCVVMSCFAMTVLLYFFKTQCQKRSLLFITVGSFIVMLSSLLIGSLGMGSLLSGLDYYINNSIFRGIKLSLIVPILYTAIAFYLMFMREKRNIFRDIKNLLLADIKVFWVLIGGFVLAVGVYYIIRSGNVEEISVFEAKMRSFLTELFAARPRTKEFLVGYPCLILLAFYMKKTNLKLLQWLLAIGTAILAASVTNSFCHVFTNYFTIVSRTINGLIIGLIIAICAFIGNLIIIKLGKLFLKKADADSEMN